MPLMRPSREALCISGLTAVLAVALLAYALFGKPAYGFYVPMKWAVGAACAINTYVLFKLSPWLLALGLPIAYSGWIEVSAKFRKTEWVPYNWATMILMGVSVFVCLVAALRVRDE